MASSQVEFASSTSPFGCINHHRVSQAKNLFNHFIRDHLNNNNKDNSHSWEHTNNNNKAKNNLGTLRFASTNNNNRRDRQDKPSSSSTVVSPNHEEPSPSLSSSSSLSPSLRKQKPPLISVPSDFSSSSSPYDDVLNHGLGASSLVQMWEKRLTQSCPNATKSPRSPSTPKSSPSPTPSSSSSSPQRSPLSEAADSSQGQIIHNNEEDHHQLRVADIIKRLTATSSEETIVDNNNNNHQQQHHHHHHHQDHQNYYCLGSPEQQSLENNIIRSFVIKSPRIRGRQAFNDLLMQMERDRHGELNNLADRAAVSKFSHRGRIQALLRLKLMQRDIVMRDPSGLPSTTSPQVIKQKQLPQGSVIMRLRERFRSATNDGTHASTEAEVDEPRTSNNRVEQENKVSSSMYDNPPNPTQNPDVLSQTDHNNKEGGGGGGGEEEEEEAPPCSDVSVPSSEARNAETSSSSSTAVEGMREEKHNNNVCDGTSSYDEMEEEEEGSGYGERIYDEIDEEEEEEEEEESNEQIYNEANSFDWISQISRPKSYWEDLRQAWYKEVLDNESQNNHDICKLLQRRTVSNFLCSDFREKMDRLMESHKGTQTNLLASRDDDEVNHHGKIGQLVEFLQQKMNNMRPAKQQEEQEQEAEEDEEEEEEEEEIMISSSYNGESDSMNQSSTSPSPWRYDGDDSASLRQPSPSPSFFHNTHQNYPSPTNNNPPSMEMELIYDLRGHVKQLYQEMAELRKSIRSCIDMQISLQKSLNNRDNNHTAKGKKSHDRVLKKGNCCICSTMKADSLFYRCGHMCTCLKCANELQWKKGMCPICEAPMVDVVRVYADA